MSASSTNESRQGRSPRRKIIEAAVSIAVVGGIFLGVLPAVADYGEVWSTITRMTWLETTILVTVAVWNSVTYWFLMVAVLPGLSFPQAAVVNQSSTAVSNTLPAGGALGVGVSYSMYSSWGFGLESAGLATVVSGVWNTFVKLGLPVVAVALLALFGGASTALVAASMAGVAVLVATIVGFWLMLRSSAAASRVGEAAERLVSRVRRLFHKNPVTGWGDAAAGFCIRTAVLIKGRWVRISAAAVVSHVSLFLVLLLALRFAGITQQDIGWLQVLAAFAFVRLISALPITPGGVGVVELGYTAALSVGFDAEMTARVVAAVLLFRFMTYVLPIPFGAFAYVYWRRNRSWRLEAATS